MTEYKVKCITIIIVLTNAEMIEIKMISIVQGFLIKFDNLIF